MKTILIITLILFSSCSPYVSHRTCLKVKSIEIGEHNWNLNYTSSTTFKYKVLIEGKEGNTFYLYTNEKFELGQEITKCE